MNLQRFIHLRLQGAAPDTPVYNDLGKGGGSPPPAPDYAGAANATAAGNAEAARIAAKANRVNQVTPYGTLSYSQDPNDQDIWTAKTDLSPIGQQLLDYQNQTSLGLGKLSTTGLGYVQDTLSKPFDWSAIAKAPVNAGTTGQDALMARLQPQLSQQRDALQTQLANQGISAGTEAYNRAMTSQNQRENDLLSQAGLYGINLDTAARQQGIQEQEFGRTEPLNILNAVRSGAQVQNPTFQQVPQQATTAGPNLLGAAQAAGQYGTDIYNAQQAQAASGMSGLFSLGSAALMGGKNPFSLGGGGVSPFSLAQFAM